MADEGDLRFQWAMHRTTFTPAQATRLVNAVGDAVEDACAAEFPASEGYETRATHLHGMLEGVRVCVSKGEEFSAVVSTQCYVEPGPHERQVAVRLVAALRHGDPPDVAIAGLLEVARPVMLVVMGSALCFAVISALWDSGIGGYFRLSLWMSFMIMMAPAIAWLLGTRAAVQLEALEATRSAFLTQARALAEHESRWRRVLHVMHDQQALLTQARALPFRR